MLFFYLLPFQMAAVMCDLCSRKIPNALITGGLIMAGAYQWSSNGPPGLLRFAGGMLTPLVLLGVLHYFRMLGAGDIKLLMMTGSFFGMEGSLKCVCLSFLAAGIFSVAAVLRSGVLRQRLQYFCQYICKVRESGKWVPYIVPEESGAYLHFSIPVLIGSLPVMGGLF